MSSPHGTRCERRRLLRAGVQSGARREASLASVPGFAAAGPMREPTMEDKHAGFDAAGEYPLLRAIFSRRSRRISKGLKSVPAGSLSYTSEQEPQPLTELEEAVLLAVTGTTGVTMPDRPF